MLLPVLYREQDSSASALQRARLFYQCFTGSKTLFCQFFTESKTLFYHSPTSALQKARLSSTTLLPVLYRKQDSLLPLSYQFFTESKTLFYHSPTSSLQKARLFYWFSFYIKFKIVLLHMLFIECSVDNY